MACLIHLLSVLSLDSPNSFASLDTIVIAFSSFESRMINQLGIIIPARFSPFRLPDFLDFTALARRIFHHLSVFKLSFIYDRNQRVRKKKKRKDGSVLR